MNSDRVLNPQPVSMIPVCLHISTGLRKSSQESLASFIQNKTRIFRIFSSSLRKNGVKSLTWFPEPRRKRGYFECA